MSVAISIVEYNTSQLLKNCLKSIFDKTFKNKMTVWVVDNASSDDSVEMIKKNFPQVKLIESKQNLGFAGGHNLALKKIKDKYVVILNSDTILDEVIDGMVDFMENNPEVGIASCKILDFAGLLQPNAGDSLNFFSILNWLFNLEVLGINYSLHRSDRKYYESPHEVGWVSGSFMIIRGEVFQRIGYLNDEYFMYFEDVEFCFRAQKAGFKIMINPKFNLKHLSGGSLDNPKFRQWTGEFKGLIKFITFEYGFLWGLVTRLMIYLAIFLRLIVFALLGKFNFSITYGKVILAI